MLLGVWPQTVSSISAFETPEGLKLDKAYQVYSQKFRREDFEEKTPFNPKNKI
jgi:type I restriction enzyme R subunit